MEKYDFLFGVHTPKAARGFPPGRVRWIMRNDEIVKAAVKTEEGIRMFVVGDAGDAWVPIPNCEQASKTLAERGPAESVQPGMVTLAVQDFADLAAEVTTLKRRLNTRIAMCERLEKECETLKAALEDREKAVGLPGSPG